MAQIGAWREVPAPDLSARQAWSCAVSSPRSGPGPWRLMAGLQLPARERREAVQEVEGRSSDWVTSFIVVTKVLCWESPGGDKTGLGSPLGSHVRVQQDGHGGHVHLSTPQPPLFPSWPLHRHTEHISAPGPLHLPPLPGSSSRRVPDPLPLRFTSLLGRRLPARLPGQPDPGPSQPPSRSVPPSRFRASSLACATCQGDTAVPRSFGCTVCVSSLAIGQVLCLQQPALRPCGAV